MAFCERTQEGKALSEVKKIPQIIGGLNYKSAKELEVFLKKLQR